ncbi:hypothetical protein M758_11G146500 [Ceratodon purpureus]|nr:hypothetical protein M758_11G146500 [Ceratodon purpureus]
MKLFGFLFRLALSLVASQQDCCAPNTNIEVCCSQNGRRGPGGHGGPCIPGGHGISCCCPWMEMCCLALDVRRCYEDHPEPPLPDRCCDDITPPYVPTPPTNTSLPLTCMLESLEIAFAAC